MSERRTRSGDEPSAASDWQPSGVVSMLTDFGTSDPYAGIMAGVVLGLAPQARIVDLTHAVPPQAVEIGALLLRSAVPYFSPGAVHLAVVDPGVGSARDPIVAVTESAMLVGPDNGLLHAAATALGLLEVRRIEAGELLLQPVSHTFHGRDVFAPVAGRLAAGLPPAAVGAVLPEMRRLDALDPVREGDRVAGSVLHVDHFGNLITNVPATGLAGERLAIEVGGRRLERLCSSYAEVAEGEILAIAGSWGMLEVAQNRGNAAHTLGVGRGDPVVVHGGSRGV